MAIGSWTRRRSHWLARRTYDSTTAFTGSTFGTIPTGVNGQTLTVTGSGSVTSANVSAGTQVLTLGTLGLANGTGRASNYQIAAGGNTGTINPEAVTVTAATNSKTYDGTTGATVPADADQRHAVRRRRHDAERDLRDSQCRHRPHAQSSGKLRVADQCRQLHGELCQHHHGCDQSGDADLCGHGGDLDLWRDALRSHRHGDRLRRRAVAVHRDDRHARLRHPGDRHVERRRLRDQRLGARRRQWQLCLRAGRREQRRADDQSGDADLCGHGGDLDLWRDALRSHRHGDRLRRRAVAVHRDDRHARLRHPGDRHVERRVLRDHRFGADRRQRQLCPSRRPPGTAAR